MEYLFFPDDDLPPDLTLEELMNDVE